MKEDFSELVEYLDEKFQKTATKDDIARLLALVPTKEEFNELKREVGEIKETLNTLLTSVDRLVKLIETYHQEQLAITSKVDRLERWITEIADKVGIELKS